MKKDIIYWKTFNYFMMVYEGNEREAHSTTFLELGYEPTTEENGL